MMECQSNIEIAVHDAGNRITSLMYFQGDNTNTITIGRRIGWGTTDTRIEGTLFMKLIYGINQQMEKIDYGMPIMEQHSMEVMETHLCLLLIMNGVITMMFKKK
jgi:hypothetical protein